MGLFDFLDKKRLEKIKQMKKEEIKKEEDYLERVIVMGKEASMKDLRRHIFSVNIRKFKLKCYEGLLNEHLHEGRAYRLQLELRPDDVKRIKQNREPEIRLQMDDNGELRYFVRGKIVTNPTRQKNKDYAIAVLDCGLFVHTRVGVTYKKNEWVEMAGTFYLSSEQLIKVGENTVLVKEIQTGINSEHGLHLMAVDSHKVLYLTSDVHGNNEYLTFKVSFSGETFNDIDDDMMIPKGSYLANDDIRKIPREIVESIGKFESFVYDEEYIYICDGSSIIKVLKHNGKVEGIKTRNDIFFKDYVAEKFDVSKEMVK